MEHKNTGKFKEPIKVDLSVSSPVMPKELGNDWGNDTKIPLPVLEATRGRALDIKLPNGTIETYTKEVLENTAVEKARYLGADKGSAVVRLMRDIVKSARNGNVIKLPVPSETPPERSR